MYVQYLEGEKFPCKNPEVSDDINDFDDAGYILEPDEVVIDLDDNIPISTIHKLIDYFKIKTQIEWTDRGCHLYYKKPTPEVRGKQGMTPLGIEVELFRKKGNQKYTSVCCKRHGVRRKVENFGVREPFPDFFRFGTYDNLLGLEVGEKRNNLLFKHKKRILKYANWRKILRFVNENILGEPLDEKEFDTLARDDAASGVADEEYQVAEYLMRELGAVFFQKRLYIRDENGKYIMEEEEIQRIVYNYCPGKKSFFVKEVIEQMRMRARRIDPNTEFRVKFKNGYLYRGEFYEDDFKGFTPFAIDIAYNPDAKPVQIVDDYLDQLSGGDKAYRDRIIEIISHCLVVNKDFKRMLAKFHIIHGNGGEGKGTFLQIIKTILGYKNCSALSIEQMDDERYAYNLSGKLSNLGDDLSSKPINDQQMKMLKNISTCDAIEIRKMRENSVTAEFTATLIFTSNHIIKSFEKSDAYKRRVDWLPIFGKPKDPDPMFISKVTTPEALEYWIKLAVDGYFRLYEQKGFTYTSIIDEYNQEYHRENDNTIMFLETMDRDQIIHKRPPEIQSLYETWCDENGEDPLSKKTLRESIQRKFGLIVKNERIKTGQTSQVIRAYAEPSAEERKRMATEYDG